MRQFSTPAYRARGSASVAERLARAGLDVLYLVTDDQLDARLRLGISGSDPDVARVERGTGSITLVGLAGAHSLDVLYRSGPGRFGRFDAIMVDTPPLKRVGALPGVLLIAPTDGDDASANLLRVLRATPTNTEIVLVRIDAVSKQEWATGPGIAHTVSPAQGHRWACASATKPSLIATAGKMQARTHRTDRFPEGKEGPDTRWIAVGTNQKSESSANGASQCASSHALGMSAPSA